ncbi:MAG: cupredoxin domain-containing protein [Actinomycetota bacterium]|nr:cupredoxin domain-containing protein [Actinomycetota bacterium]
MTASQPTTTEGRARWVTLATLGFLFSASGLLLILLAGLAFGSLSDDGPFFGVYTAVFLVGALLVWRFGTWAKVVGAILAFLAGGSLFWISFGLFRVSSIFDFLPGVLVLPGAILALVCCIAAVVATRRNHLVTTPDGGERKGIRVAFTILTTAVLLSGILTIAGRSSVGDASDAVATVKMKSFEFAPTTYSVSGGAKLLVQNKDPFAHTFTVDALGIDEDLSLGSEKLITIPARPGTYILYCTYHTSDKDKPAKDDMAATLTVT